MATQRNWGAALAMLGFAGFVAISLWAKWSPAVAQEKTAPAPAAQKSPAPRPADKTPAKTAKGKGAQARQKAQPGAKAPEFTRAIPGAGKKLDALALAKIIDQEVNLSLKSEGIPASSLAG